MSLYKTILVTLEGSPTDRAIIEHVKALAKDMKSRVVLLHVASGVAAKYHRSDAAGKEVLRHMINSGAELSAFGPKTAYIIECLRNAKERGRA